MAYHTHITPAFVLGTRPYGEANNMVQLFTRDLGMVHAFAKSTRLERSKLRPSLQEFTFGTVSLVRGKEYWRVIGMIHPVSLYYALRSTPKKLEALIRIGNLLCRAIPGEEQNSKIYRVVASTARKLVDPKINNNDCAAVEALAAARILAHLGYIGDVSFTYLLHEEETGHDSIILARTMYKDIVRSVNTALRESGL